MSNLFGGSDVRKEKFVDDNEAKQMTGTIFIIIGCMGVSATVSFLLYWAYMKEKTLFAGILWALMFCYAIINLAFIIVSKSKMKSLPFRFFIGLHSVISLMTLMLFTAYLIKASSNIRNAAQSQKFYQPPPMM